MSRAHTETVKVEENKQQQTTNKQLNIMKKAQ